MPIGKLFSVLVASMMYATGATALSCDPYTFIDDFWFHDQASQKYLLVVGAYSNFRFLRTEDGSDIWAAQFSGHKHSKNAFDVPFETDVTVSISQFDGSGGPDATLPRTVSLTGVTGLIWLEQTNGGFAAYDPWCSPAINTDPKDQRRALRCLNGGFCPNRLHN